MHDTPETGPTKSLPSNTPELARGGNAADDVHLGGLFPPHQFRAASRLAATAAIAVLLTGCAGVWERYDEAGHLVSRTTIAWSISPRIVETDQDGASVLVTDTAESLKAAGELAGTAAGVAARKAVTP